MVLADITGRQILRRTIQKGEQEISLVLDPARLSNGTYLLTVLVDGHIMKEKLQKRQ